MSLKLYFDLMSPPSRALYILFGVTKLPYESCPIALLRREHLTKEYKKINKLQRVPAIDYNGFKVSESIAIIRYLSALDKIPDEWYPKSPEQRAKIDEYLQWHSYNTHIYCGIHILKKFYEPVLMGLPRNHAHIVESRELMGKCLDLAQKLWFTPGNYILGDRMTVADLLTACMLEQTRFVGYDPTEGRPVLTSWLERIRTELNPLYGEAHELINELADQFNNEESLDIE